jgi:serine phosphatase RsbU (regulator of sigma subunit)
MLPGLVLIVLLVTALATPKTLIPISYAVLAPVIASSLWGALPTALYGVLGTATAIACAQRHGNVGDRQQIARYLLVIIVAIVCSGMAAVRVRRQHSLEHVSAIAEKAQRAILRPLPVELGDLRLAGRYVSATKRAHVGGDFYEAVDTPTGVRLLIGDVRGKGLDAVRISSVVVGVFRHVSYSLSDPAEVMTELSAAVMREIDTEDFVTTLIVDCAAERFRVVNAGHHPPLYVRAGHAPVLLDLGEHSPPLGIAEKFTTVEFGWSSGDRLMLYTDGIAEGRNRKGRFFDIANSPVRAEDGTLEEALDKVLESLRSHAGRKLHDDLALVLALNAPMIKGAMSPDGV